MNTETETKKPALEGPLGTKFDHQPIEAKHTLPESKRGPHSTVVSTDAVADLKAKIETLKADLKAAEENLAKLTSANAS